MADGLIDMIIQSADFDSLTARPSDVMQGKAFVGAGGIEAAGEIIDRGSPVQNLELNGSLTLPAGNYAGGSIQQNIPTMGEVSVTPGSREVTVSTKDRYMTGNIRVALLENLKPENIKLGEYVGGVGPGTWEGYVIADPNTFYYRGAFAQGQSLSDYIVREASDDTYNTGTLVLEDTLKCIRFTCVNLVYKKCSYLLFNVPINLTALSKVTIQYSFHKESTSTAKLILKTFLCAEKYTEYYQANEYNFSTTDFRTDEKDTESKIRTLEIDVSGFSRQAYLSFFLQVARKDDIFYLHSVKFE